MQIRLIKEGKEYNQAIGYLEDGTMVVVDSGKHLIGQTLQVEVTSALQTSAGRMIFAKPVNTHHHRFERRKEHSHNKEQSKEQNKEHSKVS